MNRDQAYGWVIFLGSLAVIGGYIWLLFFPPVTGIDNLVLKLTGVAAIGLGFGIMAWIGYTLATTPPPQPIEDIEKEIAKEITEAGNIDPSEEED